MMTAHVAGESSRADRLGSRPDQTAHGNRRRLRTPTRNDRPARPKGRTGNLPSPAIGAVRAVRLNLCGPRVALSLTVRWPAAHVRRPAASRRRAERESGLGGRPLSHDPRRGQVKARPLRRAAGKGGPNRLGAPAAPGAALGRRGRRTCSWRKGKAPVRGFCRALFRTRTGDSLLTMQRFLLVSAFSSADHLPPAATGCNRGAP
jgi:hypothetical protein